MPSRYGSGGPMTQDDILKKVKSGEISAKEGLHLIESTFTRLADIDIERDRRAMEIGFPSIEAKHYISYKKPDLLVLGGRPGVGKTAMLMQLAYNASEKHNVAVFSLEMTKEQLKKRLLAQINFQNISKLDLLTDKEIRETNQKLSARNLFIDDTPGLLLEQLVSRAKSMHRQYGLDLVAVDYLQIIPSQHSGSKKEQVAKACERLKTLAKDIGCPVLVAAQLNRDIEKRAQDPDVKVVEPAMSDFGDAAEIEHWADGAFILFKDKKIHGSSDVGFYTVKYRHGEASNLTLKFSGSVTRFVDTQEF